MAEHREKRERADDQRTVTISIKRKLVARIDALAVADKRSRSNWIVSELERAVDEKERQKKTMPGVPAAVPRSSSSIDVLHGANETPGDYKTSPRKQKPR